MNGRPLRRLTLGTGPLTRTSDRLQRLARLLMAVILLSAVPIAGAVATATYSQTRDESAAQAQARHQVSATLVEDARTSASSGGESAPRVGRAVASWPVPSGDDRVGTVPAPAGARAGSTVTIWVDQAGDLSKRPLGDDDVTASALGHGLLTWLGISAIALGGYAWARKLLDRSRMLRWAADWARVEPGWTRELS